MTKTQIRVSVMAFKVPGPAADRLCLVLAISVLESAWMTVAWTGDKTINNKIAYKLFCKTLKALT